MRVDPRARVVDGHELDVELAVEVEVGDVRLSAGHAVEPADAGRRAADAATSGRRVARRSLGRGRSAARRALDRLDDLLVAGAATQVAGEALLDLGPRRVRDVGQERRPRDELARDAEAALDGAGLEERRLDGCSRSPSAPAPRRS